MNDNLTTTSALNNLLSLNNKKILISEVNEETILESKKTKQKIEELENIVAKDAEASLNYALQNKKRFIKGEEVIKKHANYAYKYAKEIINQRWEEAEPTILESIKYSYFYSKLILNKRWNELEKKIIKKESFKDEEYFSKYIIRYIDFFSTYKRFYEMEEVLAEKLSIKKLFEYWKFHVPAGKLSETGHNKIIASALSGDRYAQEYVDLLSEQNSRFISYLQSLEINKNITIQELIDHVSATSVQKNNFGN